MSIAHQEICKQTQLLDAHVVILNNYVRKHHVDSYRELAKRVRKLTVLLSVPMEPDRSWKAQWSGLDVRVQKNFMFTASWKHSTGFNEPNFIHIPVDTTSQLKKLKPDIVFSYEMGMRTLLSSWFRRFHPTVPLVMVGNMSEFIERERGVFRRMLRWMIRKGVDYFTYNGPSCKRYLQSLSIPEEKLFHLPYCIDTDSVYIGPRDAGDETEPVRLVYCGALSQRKGILEFAEVLSQWCLQNPDRRVELEIAGTGDLEATIQAQERSNLSIVMLGNCDNVQLQDAYRRANICAFPSFADEWGLVPIEGMASGLPVLGSLFAQSVEAVVEEGVSGWVFKPNDRDSMLEAIDRALRCDHQRLAEMGELAKSKVSNISAETTAEKFSEIVESVLSVKKVGRVSSNTFLAPGDLGSQDLEDSGEADEAPNRRMASVSIVVPCYNEVPSIPNLADHLVQTKQELQFYDIEFVFVDDGSSDETFDVLSDHFSGWSNAKIIQHDQNKGLMAAVMTGAKHSRGEIICTIDSDCTYDPTRLIDLLPHLDEGVGMVTGSPYHPQGAILNVPKWRVWISYSASWLYRIILKSRIYCYTSSFRAYRKAAIDGIELQNSGFVGTTEILWKLEQNGWDIKEVPSVLSVRKFGQSKIRIVQVTFDHLKMMKRILFSRFRRTTRKQEEGICSTGNVSQAP